MGEGPGKTLAGLPWIIAVTIFQVGTIAVLLYLLIRLWPHPTPSTEPAEQNAVVQQKVTPNACGNCQERAAAARKEVAVKGKPSYDPECISFFGCDVLVWNEQRLLLLVLIAGALGGFVRGVRSLYWFVGNRSLVVSWTLMYFMLPLSGALIALFLYLVLRGGLFSPQTSISDTSPFGFVAMAALAGMFSGSAAEKLKDIFELLFKKEAPGRDAATNPKPVLTAVTPVTTAAGTAVALTVTGSSFVNDSKVTADGKTLSTKFVSDTSLTADLPADLVAAAKTIKIAVMSPEPGGGTSDATLDFTVT